jgi:hypothetical protein
MKKLLVVLILLTLILTGCKKGTVSEDLTATIVDEEPTTAVAGDEIDTDVEAQADDTSPEPTESMVPTPLPIDPLNLKFMTSDEVELDGEFWAPTYPNAPVVVLMHQYPMDHNIEWVAIAPWLQNRGLAQFVRSGGELWSDPRWFSPIIEGVDFGVFTFTFRNCLGGCREDSVESREEWILDAVAAIESAASFITVDSQKVIVVGTSIGADAAVNACARLLDSEKVTCIGAVSLSPGSFLGVSYADSVNQLVEAGVPVKCVAAEGDTLSADTCNSIEADGFESIVTTGSAHGIRLFDPSLPIDLSVLLQAWLVEWAYVE